MVYVIVAVAALIVGGICGYMIFRYVLKGKFNEMVEAAGKEAEVIKEKKLLEVAVVRTTSTTNSSVLTTRRSCCQSSRRNWRRCS